MARLKDLTGQTFGRLTVVARAQKPGRSTYTGAYWECVCTCGQRTVTRSQSLLSGYTRSCGCLITDRLKDLTGQRFGRLVVLERSPRPPYMASRNPWWRCKCDCGAITVVEVVSLRRGSTRSCGCLNSELTAERNRARAKKKGDQHGSPSDRNHLRRTEDLRPCSCKVYQRPDP